MTSNNTPDPRLSLEPSRRDSTLRTIDISVLFSGAEFARIQLYSQVGDMFTHGDSKLHYGTINRVERTSLSEPDHDSHGLISQSYSLLLDQLTFSALLSSSIRTPRGQKFWENLRPLQAVTKLSVSSDAAQLTKESLEVCDSEDSVIAKGNNYLLCKDLAMGCRVINSHFGIWGKFEVRTESGHIIPCIYDLIKHDNEEREFEAMFESEN